MITTIVTRLAADQTWPKDTIQTHLQPFVDAGKTDGKVLSDTLSADNTIRTITRHWNIQEDAQEWITYILGHGPISGSVVS